MRSIKTLRNIKGKRALVRVDFNEPVSSGKVQDDFRIRKALPTILNLKKKGAKIILISHLGQGRESLAGIAEAVNEHLEIKFIPEIFSSKVQEEIAAMENGQVVLLENLRNDPGEKSCSKIFAIELAKLGDFYVNEAFSDSHREDASIVLLPKLLPAYAGLQLEEEIKNLSMPFENPKRPFLAILGGAKFSTKMPLIKKYLELADHVFIGGALHNDFLKSLGYEIGQSLIDAEEFDLKPMLQNKKLVLPLDVLVNSPEGHFKRKVNEVRSNESIIDIGENSVAKLEELISNSKLILWNGPLGKYEEEGEKATEAVLRAISESSAQSIIGGGDLVSIIDRLGIEDKFSFVSTGGGATLDFLIEGSLPGIRALG